MAEIPQQLPIEEEIKQDSRFSRLLEISPTFAGPLSSVFAEAGNRNYKEYSEFWMRYCVSYNSLVKVITDEVGDDGKEALEEFEKQRLDLIGRLIVVTHEPKLFKTKKGKLLNKTMVRLSQDAENISDWEPLFSDILVEVADMLPTK